MICASGMYCMRQLGNLQIAFGGGAKAGERQLAVGSEDAPGFGQGRRDALRFLWEQQAGGAGTLVDVGRGRRPPSFVRDALLAFFEDRLETLPAVSGTWGNRRTA